MSDRQGRRCIRLPIIGPATDRDAGQCLWCGEQEGLVRVAQDGHLGPVLIIVACRRCLASLADAP